MKRKRGCSPRRREHTHPGGETDPQAAECGLNADPFQLFTDALARAFPARLDILL